MRYLEIRSAKVWKSVSKSIKHGNNTREQWERGTTNGDYKICLIRLPMKYTYTHATQFLPNFIQWSWKTWSEHPGNVSISKIQWEEKSFWHTAEDGMLVNIWSENVSRHEIFCLLVIMQSCTTFLSHSPGYSGFPFIKTGIKFQILCKVAWTLQTKVTMNLGNQ